MQCTRGLCPQNHHNVWCFSHYVKDDVRTLYLSVCHSELTGVSEGGGKTGGGGGGGGGGGEYVVSSKWARDLDINLKIRSVHTTLPPSLLNTCLKMVLNCVYVRI